MKVLIMGSGGREHALAWKISQSPLLTSLYIAPGNAGTSLVGNNVSISVSDFDAVKSFVLEKNIGMIVVGPEQPLVDGIHDYFLAVPALSHVHVIGPVKQAAMLEGSKDFAKAFMIRHGIPTAKYRTFSKDQMREAAGFLETFSPPYVLKADGLAAGKGVLIIESRNEAIQELRSMLLEAKFGRAGEKVIIEEYLKGIELSAFVLCDGKSYKILPSAKDYKRIGDGDTGLNTGGMGSVSPVPFAGDVFMKKVEERIIRPTIEGLISEKIDYKGFIFFGLMNVNGEPYMIEYNARMGDPEAEVVIPLIKSDLLSLFISLGEQELNKQEIILDGRHAACIMLVSGGYPGDYLRGKIISGIDKVKDSIVFHAGTAIDNENGNILTNGGRVLAVTSFGDSMTEAIETSYRNAGKITWDGIYFRKDIGQDLSGYDTH